MMDIYSKNSNNTNRNRWISSLLIIKEHHIQKVVGYNNKRWSNSVQGQVKHISVAVFNILTLKINNIVHYYLGKNCTYVLDLLLYSMVNLQVKNIQLLLSQDINTTLSLIFMIWNTHTVLRAEASKSPEVKLSPGFWLKLLIIEQQEYVSFMFYIRLPFVCLSGDNNDYYLWTVPGKICSILSADIQKPKAEVIEYQVIKMPKGLT